MTKLGIALRRMLGNNRGISSVEYALLLAVIGGGIVLAAGALSTSISNEMTQAANCINGTSVECPQP
jgi:Flp pilus assembly pilin Flp